PPFGDVGPVAIDPDSPTTLYTAIIPGSVFKTTDGGASWVATHRGLPDSGSGAFVSSLAIDPADPETVYAGSGPVFGVSFGTGNAVFRTTDGGATWTSFNLGLTSAIILGLAIDPLVPTRIYAATQAGVFAFGTCGDGILDPGEVCEAERDGTFGPCCTSDCQFAPPGTTCRDSAGDCDLPDMCSGSDPKCVDGRRTGVVCREAKGLCDVAEVCLGGVSCPPDGFASGDTLCRPANGPCDRAEFCSGTGPSCPPDGFASGDTVCRPANG